MSTRFLTFLVIFVDHGHDWARLHGLGDHGRRNDGRRRNDRLDRFGLDDGLRFLRCWFHKFLGVLSVRSCGRATAGGCSSVDGFERGFVCCVRVQPTLCAGFQWIQLCSGLLQLLMDHYDG
jgi:hypothetical protein